MTQIKIYETIASEDLEKAINEFLAAAPANVEILDVKYAFRQGLMPTHVGLILYVVHQEGLAEEQEVCACYYQGFHDGAMVVADAE